MIDEVISMKNKCLLTHDKAFHLTAIGKDQKNIISLIFLSFYTERESSRNIITRKNS